MTSSTAQESCDIYVKHIEDRSLCTVNANSDVTFNVAQLYIANSSLKKLTFICSFIVKREVYDKKTIAKELCNIYITIIEN